MNTLEKRQKKLRDYYLKNYNDSNIKNNISSKNYTKKEIKKKNKYLDKLFTRIFLSTLLLLMLVGFSKIKTVNTFIKDKINNEINIMKFVNLFTGEFSSVMPIIGDQLVYSSNVYDHVTYQNNINHIRNDSFNGVTNLTDGIITKILKDQNGRYLITIMATDDYQYTYSGLESCDYNIFSYVSKDTILGLATYNRSYDAYLFDLTISKEGVYFDFYENAED